MRQILFASQDPGSANALAPVIKSLIENYQNNFGIQVLAKAHSKIVFRKENIRFTEIRNNNQSDFESKITKKPCLIILGSSIGPCVEKQAISYARKNKIQTISILDFWANYSRRFSKNQSHDLYYLPDYVFIMDNISKKQMILEGFPKEKLIVTGNPYFDTVDAHGNTSSHLNKTRSILYISQPINISGTYHPDIGIITDLIKIRDDIDKNLHITIKTHPKEDHTSYESLKEKNITIETTKNPKILLKTHNIIVGKHSMLLFEAVLQKKIVISYQTVQESFDRLITNNLGLSYRVNNPEELKQTLEKALNNQIPVPDTKKLNMYLDGKNTQRVIDEIKKILEK